MRKAIIAGLGALALAGCNLDAAWAQYCAQHDGGCDGGITSDAGTPDSGSVDSGTPDSGTVDSGTPDAGPTGPDPTGPLAANIVIGDGVVEANTDPHTMAIADGSDAVATRSTTVGRLWAYLGDGTTAQQLIIGLYDDHQGHPHTLLASGTINGVTTRGWYTTTVSPTAVTAGTTYWIAIVAPTGTFTFPYATNVTGRSTEHSVESTLTALPASWTTGATFPGTQCSFAATD
jgi:hypothetical protein